MKEVPVFIPAYNASQTIAETLEAIGASALFAEIIVKVYIYDDCSTDNTLDIIRNYSNTSLELLIFRNEVNLGERGTLNKGFKELSGDFDWAIIIHADDIPKPEWLSVILEGIRQSDQNSVFSVWSSYDSLNDEDKKIFVGDTEGSSVMNRRTIEEGRRILTKITSIWHVSGAAVNLLLFQSIGNFDKNLAQYGDTDFFVAGILKGFSDVYIRKTLTIYRVITSSVSHISKSTNRDIKEMHYLVRKYSSILSSAEKKKIMALALRFGVKRSIKSIFLGDFNFFLETSRLNFKSLGISFLEK